MYSLQHKDLMVGLDLLLLVLLVTQLVVEVEQALSELMEMQDQIVEA
jgi:hypothetical protein